MIVNIMKSACGRLKRFRHKGNLGLRLLAIGGFLCLLGTVPSSRALPILGCSNPTPGTIWCDDFETDNLSNYFEHDTTNGFNRIAGVGYGNSTGMRATFVPGTSMAGDLKLAFGKTPSTYFKPVDAGTANYRDIYWRAYLKNQVGWVGGGGDKFTRVIVFASSNWAEAAMGYLWNAESGSNYLGLDPARGTDAAGTLKTTHYNDSANTTWLGAVNGTTPIFDNVHIGQWQCIEGHMKLNDAGQSNGVFEYWLNGNLEAQKTGMNWLGSYNTYGINAVFFENYWNNTSPVTEYRDWDNIAVATQRIGCLGGQTTLSPPTHLSIQ